MQIFLYFFLLIIFYFLYYIYIIFFLFQKDKEKEYEDIIKKLIENNLFDQIKNSNTFSRILIKGDLDENVLKESLKKEKNKLKEIDLKLSEQNFDEEYNNLIRKSEFLKIDNENLNKELTRLKREFKNKVGNTSNLSVFKTPSRESKTDDLLHYLYKDIKF